MTDTILGNWSGALLLLAQVEPPEENNTIWEGWGSVIFVIAILAIVAAVVLGVLWQVFSTKRATIAARETVARDEAYRKLAEESAAAQQRTAEELARTTEELAKIRVHVTEMERMLKEVE